MPNSNGASPAGVANMWDTLVKALPGLALTAVIAILSFGWNARGDQATLHADLEQLKKRAEINAQNIVENSKAIQQNTIRIAEISGAQQSIVGVLSDLREDQREIKAQLQRR